jgi:hypothetical protein
MHPAVSRKSNWAPKSEILGVGDEFPSRECPLLAFKFAPPECACECVFPVCGGSFIAPRSPFRTAYPKPHTPFTAKTAANRPDSAAACVCIRNFDRNMRRSKSGFQQQSILWKNLPNLECLQHFQARRENNGRLRFRFSSTCGNSS